MRKGDDGEKKTGKRENKIKMFLGATNVVASQPPERRPTATLMLVPQLYEFEDGWLGRCFHKVGYVVAG